MDDRTPENRAPSEFAKDVENEPTGEVGRGAVGCVLIALGFAVGFAPFIIPGAFGGSLVAGWYLVNTIPFGLIIGLIGIVAIAASGSRRNPAATTSDKANAPTDSPDAVHPVDLYVSDSASTTEQPREDTLAEVFPELPAWFGKTQIAIMTASFIGLLIARILWFSTNPENWLLMLTLAFDLPITIGLAVSAVIVIRSLRLRFNTENRWSAREYGRLYRIQRAFAIPAYLSLVYWVIAPPTMYFDDSNVGSAEGIVQNHIMGYSSIAHPLIAIAAHLACLGMYAYYRRAIAKVSV